MLVEFSEIGGKRTNRWWAGASLYYQGCQLGIPHKLKIIWAVFIVASHVEIHHSVQESLGYWMEAKQRITIDVEKLARAWVRATHG